MKLRGGKEKVDDVWEKYPRSLKKGPKSPPTLTLKAKKEKKAKVVVVKPKPVNSTSPLTMKKKPKGKGRRKRKSIVQSKKATQPDPFKRYLKGAGGPPPLQYCGGGEASVRPSSTSVDQGSASASLSQEASEEDVATPSSSPPVLTRFLAGIVAGSNGSQGLVKSSSAGCSLEPKDEDDEEEEAPILQIEKEIQPQQAESPQSEPPPPELPTTMIKGIKLEDNVDDEEEEEKPMPTMKQGTKVNSRSQKRKKKGGGNKNRKRIPKPKKEEPDDDDPVAAVVTEEPEPVLSPMPTASLLAVVAAAPISAAAPSSQLRRSTRVKSVAAVAPAPAPTATSLAMVPHTSPAMQAIRRQWEHAVSSTSGHLALKQKPGTTSRRKIRGKQEPRAAGTSKRMVRVKEKEEPEKPSTSNKLAVPQKREPSKPKPKRRLAICQATPEPNLFGGIPDQTVLPRSQFSPYSSEYFRELVDNWEYTGLRTQGDLAEPAIQKEVKNQFWHYLQFEAGRPLCVMVEQLPQPEDTPEGSTFLIFKVCTIDVKQGKLFHEVAATTKLLYPTKSRSSYYFHIVDEAVAKRLNVSLKTMMRAWEKAYGVVLSRRIHFTDGWKNDKERDEMMLRLQIEVGLIPDPNAPAPPAAAGSQAEAQQEQEQQLQLYTQQGSEEVDLTPD